MAEVVPDVGACKPACFFTLKIKDCPRAVFSHQESFGAIKEPIGIEVAAENGFLFCSIINDISFLRSAYKGITVFYFHHCFPVGVAIIFSIAVNKRFTFFCYINEKAML